MKRIFGLILLTMCVVAEDLAAQDERFLREIFSGDVLARQSEAFEQLKKVHFVATGPLYQFDLTGDHRNESILIEKRDGQDWFHLYNYEMKKILSYKLQARAQGSSVYRLRVVRLSKTALVVLIHHFEGINEYLKTHANSRVHMLTIENNDLTTASVNAGPRYWFEFQDGRETFSRRRYEIELIDLDKNGTRELIVRYNSINSVHKFLGNGRWVEI
jgi:hypothetical protein